MAFCEKCGCPLESDALFCERCGRPVPQDDTAAAAPKRAAKAAKKAAAIIHTINTQAPDSLGETVVASWKD